MADAKRDQNFVPTLLGVSSVDGVTPVRIYVNPTTHRLLVDLSGGGSGTVKTVAVATANGFAGTSDGDPANPTVTLTTTVSGLVKGNGTALSAAVAGTDYTALAFKTISVATQSDVVADTAADTLTLVAGSNMTITTDATTDTITFASAGGSGLTVGTTTITSGTTTRILYNNVGVLGEYTLTGSGTVVAMATAPTFVTSITTPAVLATANDSGALGASGTAFSDLFLASGGVINWSAGDISLTHAAGMLTISDTAAGAAGPILEIYQDSASPAAADVVGKIDFMGRDSANNKQEYAYVSGLISSPTSTAEAGYLDFGWVSAGAVASRVLMSGATIMPTTNDAIALGSTTNMFSDLFLANGAVINFNNGNATLTHSAGLLTSNVSMSLGTSNTFTTGTIELGAASDTTIARVSAGVVSIEGNNIVTNTSSPTLGTITTTGNIELGNASDTTLARVSAGVVSIEGSNIMTVGANQTVTGQNKFNNIIDVNNAITATANAATVPVTYRLSTVTNNSAATLTITMATASAVDGQMTIVRILDFSAVAQTISWVNTEDSTVTAPTTSNGSTTLPLTVGFMYNSGTSKWRCIAKA